MLLFDIDGVITEPLTGEVAIEVVDEIIEVLERGEPVAFNTGRGLKWVLRDIVPHFEQRISTKSLLNQLCIVYEKGAFRITFNKEGELEKPVVATGVALVPRSLRTEVLELITSRYAGTMFPGEEKEAVLSPQMLPGSGFARFKADQEQLVADLQDMLRQHGLDTKFRVDPTRIAIDVEDIILGKAMGSQRVLEWLRIQRIQPEYFIAFGDSKSDVGMAEEICGNHFPVELVFVGGKEQLEGMSFPFTINFTQAHCEKGTAEYLRNPSRKRKY